MNPVPTLICVDVEPDARRPDLTPRSGWQGFEGSLRLFEESRCRADVEALFCWFLRMDPQVEVVHGSALWVFERYGAQIESLRDAGDEIGLHTHAWRRVGEKWVTDNGDQGWVNQCVRLSFDAYKSAFRHVCRSFRFGDHWMNDETFDLVESLGARYDLTVEPGMRPSAGELPGETWTGRFPDYAHVPRAPYTPARGDFKARGEARGKRNMWVIPVSTVRPRWHAAPLYKRLVRRVRYGRRLYPLSLALEPSDFRHSVRDVVEGGSARHLCVVVRTDSVLHRLEAVHVRENLAFLLSQAAGGRVQLTTPARLVEDERIGRDNSLDLTTS